MYQYSIQYLYDKLVSIYKKQERQSHGLANEDSDASQNENAFPCVYNIDLDKTNYIEHFDFSKHYTSDSVGRALLEKDYEKPIEAAKAQIRDLEDDKESILSNSIAVRLARYVEQPSLWLVIVMTFLLLVFSLAVAGLKGWLLFLFIEISVIWGLLEWWPKLRQKLEEKAAIRAGNRWLSLNNQIQRATADLKKIEAERLERLIAIFDKWPTYPPDWEYRTEAAKERDNYTCTNCGYPEGFKRKSRQLHVHHKIPISRGGTHETENLITLCHICHRKVDKSHATVRRTPSPRRRRYR